MIVKKEEKKTKKEAKKGTKKMTDSDTQPGAVKEAELAKEDEVKPKKNEPRPYVSKPIEKPKKEPKTQHKVSKAEDQ